MAKISANDADLKERILSTTEKLLRRYGARKLSVVDVAREIGMSHGNVYRFFDSKTVLLKAISERFLCKVVEPLTVITQSDGPADQRLIDWINTIRSIKRQRFLDDPEMFALYGEIAEEAGYEVTTHIEHLVDQLEHIVLDGQKQKIFHVKDARQSARAALNATMRLHHPVFVAAPNYPSDEEANFLINMVVAALKVDVRV